MYFFISAPSYVCGKLENRTEKSEFLAKNTILK